MQIDLYKVFLLFDINVNLVCLGQFFRQSDKLLSLFLPFRNWSVNSFILALPKFFEKLRCFGSLCGSRIRDVACQPRRGVSPS